MVNATGEAKEPPLRLTFDRLLKVEVHGTRITSDGGLLAYGLGNFLRTLALPDEVAQRSLTTLREKLNKTGARIVRHGCYAVFQLAEVAVPRDFG